MSELDKIPPGTEVANVVAEMASEAFEKTGGDIYRAGKPLLNDPGNQHREESKPKEETEKPEPTSGEPKLVHGKWKTMDEAERGVHDLIEFANSQKARADQTDAKVEALTAALEAVVGKKPNGDGRVEEEDPLAVLEALAIPREPIQKAIQAGVKREMENLVKPLAERQKADMAIKEIYPDYEKDFDELIEFLEKNPEIKKEVQYAESQGQFLMARKYAYVHFAQQKKVSDQGEVTEKAKKREDKIREALPDAGLTQGATRSDTRHPPAESEWPSNERMERLKTLARDGHEDPLWRETIGRILEKQGFPANR